MLDGKRTNKDPIRVWDSLSANYHRATTVSDKLSDSRKNGASF
jgi:hypothetical protein